MWNFSDKLQSNFESTTTSSFQRNSKSTQNLPSQNAQVPNCISANRNSSLSNNLTAVSFPYTKQPASSFLQQSNILNSQKPSFSSSFACGEGLPVHCDFHRRGRSGNSNFSTSMISIMSSISNLPTYTQQHSETLILFEVFGNFYFHFIQEIKFNSIIYYYYS